MTKELLQRYADICEELRDIEKAGGSDSILSREKAEIEAFAAALPYGKRKLVRAVMKHGTCWDVVRREIHSHKSADAVRKEYERIFKKF